MQKCLSRLWQNGYSEEGPSRQGLGLQRDRKENVVNSGNLHC